MQLKSLIQKRWVLSAEGYTAQVKDELKNEGSIWKRYIEGIVAPEPGISILEPCCGPGFLSIALSGKGRDITGVDECAAMLEGAKANAEKNRSFAKFIQGDCHRLPYPDESFDLVVARNSLWTLYNPAEAYREWVRILRPGGRLLIFDSNWGAEFYDQELMERKIKHRIKNKMPVEDYYYGDYNLGRELAVRSMLANVKRPDWDFSVLSKVRMDISVDMDSWKILWNEEKIKFYGYLPMFIINAKKTNRTKKIKKKVCHTIAKNTKEIIYGPNVSAEKSD